MKNMSSFLQFQLGIHKNRLSNGPYIDGKKLDPDRKLSKITSRLHELDLTEELGRPKALFDL